VTGELQSILSIRCQACHGSPPLMGVPVSLVSTSDFMRPAITDPQKTTAEVAVARVTSMTPLRMPPPPLDPLTPAETEVLRKWVQSAMVAAAPCPTPAPGTPAPTPGMPPTGTPAPGAGTPAPPPNPFTVPAKCSSGRTGTTGGSALMEPGRACVSCHLSSGRGGDDDLIAKDGEGGGGEGGRGRGGEGGEGGQAPRLAFAGTVFPSAHEPNRCVASDSQGAKVVVLDSTGRTFTATVNAAGNYFMLASAGNPTPPLKAKVVFNGRERAMIGSVPHGDCNGCHTQNGSTTVNGGVKSPGRILLP
jgi:hypothetical protein